MATTNLLSKGSGSATGNGIREVDIDKLDKLISKMIKVKMPGKAYGDTSEEKKILEFCYAKKIEGYSYAQIAAVLNTANIQSSSGSRWTFRALKGVMNRAKAKEKKK